MRRVIYSVFSQLNSQRDTHAHTHCLLVLVLVGMVAEVWMCVRWFGGQPWQPATWRCPHLQGATHMRSLNLTHTQARVQAPACLTYKLSWICIWIYAWDWLVCDTPGHVTAPLLSAIHTSDDEHYVIFSADWGGYDLFWSTLGGI